MFDGLRCLASNDVTDMGPSLKVCSHFSCCSMVHFCDGLFGLISMAGAGPSVLKFEYGGAGAGLGWS